MYWHIWWYKKCSIKSVKIFCHLLKSRFAPSLHWNFHSDSSRILIKERIPACLQTIASLQNVFRRRLRQTCPLFYSLSSRNSHPHCFVYRSKSKAKKTKCAKILPKNPAKLLLERSSTCRETLSCVLNISNELSCLLLSPIETCLNSSQSSIPFLSRRNKINECVEILIYYRNLADNINRTWNKTNTEIS